MYISDCIVNLYLYCYCCLSLKSLEIVRSAVIYFANKHFPDFPQAFCLFLFCAAQIGLCYNDLFTALSSLINCEFQAVMAWRGGTLSDSLFSSSLPDPLCVPCGSHVIRGWVRKGPASQVLEKSCRVLLTS